MLMIEKTIRASEVQVHVVSCVDFLKIFAVTGTKGILGPIQTEPEEFEVFEGGSFHSENASNAFRPHNAGEI